MDWLRAGVREEGSGIEEENVRKFVAYGGYGALAGAGTGCVIRNYFRLGGLASPAVVLSGTALGHMVGHEYARREFNQ